MEGCSSLLFLYIMFQTLLSKNEALWPGGLWALLSYEKLLYSLWT